MELGSNSVKKKVVSMIIYILEILYLLNVFLTVNVCHQPIFGLCGPALL